VNLLHEASMFSLNSLPYLTPMGVAPFRQSFQLSVSQFDKALARAMGFKISQANEEKRIQPRKLRIKVY
jgi:hypothetical protein